MNANQYTEPIPCYADLEADISHLPMVQLCCNNKRSPYFLKAAEVMEDYFEPVGRTSLPMGEHGRRHILFMEHGTTDADDDFYMAIDRLEEINGDVLTHSAPYSWTFGDVGILCINF